jgi:D-alanyl-D-alanine carboxypeptidase
LLLAASNAGASSLQKIQRDVVGWRFTPSISLAVVANGKIAYTGAYGNADLETKRPATPETRYPIGSVGGLFLAVAIVQLERKHKLHLDDPLARYVSDAPAGITLRQLLPPQADQSDQRYDMLGAVIERVSGEPLLTYLTDRVFRPAGMTNTWFGQPPEWMPLALGYYEWKDDFGPASTPNDAWNRKCCSYVSTATDLARFSAALFNGTLLPPSALRSLEPAFLSAQKGGMQAMGRLGSPEGYDAELALFVRQRFAIVTLANASGFPATAVLDRVFAAYYPAAATASAAASNAGDPNPTLTARLSGFLQTKIGGSQPPAIEYLSSSESAGSTEYRYLFTASGATKSVFFVLNAKSEIDGFWVH